VARERKAVLPLGLPAVVVVVVVVAKAGRRLPVAHLSKVKATRVVREPMMVQGALVVAVELAG